MNYISLALFITALLTVSVGGQAQQLSIANCKNQADCTSCARIAILPANNTCAPLSKEVAKLTVPGNFFRINLPSTPAISARVAAYFWPTGSPPPAHPCSGKPMQIYDQLCGTCFQYPPRYTTCRVVNGSTRVFVQSCGADASCDPSKCKSVSPSDHGLGPGECMAHPGVPGLYLTATFTVPPASADMYGFETQDQCEMSKHGHAAAAAASYSFFAVGNETCFGGMQMKFVV